jgi:acetyl-CoA acetyltransferase
MATATATITLPKTQGGAFLIEERLPSEIFTPEDLTPEHLAITHTADEFWAKDTVTADNSSQTSDGEAVAIVMSDRKARELGLKPMARFVSFLRQRASASPSSASRRR